MESVLYILAALGQPVLGALAVALMAVATWAVARLADRLGVDRDHEILHGLMDYADSAVRLAAKKLGKRLDDLTPEDVPSIVEEAADWVAENAPIWASRLGFDKRRLRQFVESRLP